MQSLCTSLASKEGAVISPAATVELGSVTCPPSLSFPRTPFVSLKPTLIPPSPPRCPPVPLPHVPFRYVRVRGTSAHDDSFASIIQHPPSDEYERALRHALIFRLYAIILQQP